MLAPDDRLTLLDALRPPPAHRLDFAVGTTFSLSLDALLTAPAAFALLEAEASAVPMALEPVELLDSVRRHADRILVFHQTGQVAVPAPRRLLAFLERSVVAVRAPRGGVFHPKLWVLRFVGSRNGARRYRILCASRNLTFDRSWDTLLRLDSTDDQSGADQAGIATLLRRLPSMAVVPLPNVQRTALAGLADEVEAAAFQPAAPARTVRFWPLGLDGAAPWPFPERCDRLLVVSPFLTVSLLRRLPAARGRSVLISRTEELDRLPPGTLAQFDEIYTLAPDADTDLAVDDSAGQAARRPTADDPAASLRGLHAKLYVVDAGPETRLLTGSANATTAAFDANVEVLAELRMPARVAGVDAILGRSQDPPAGLARLLAPYRPPEAGPAPAPGEDSLDVVRRAVAAIALRARVEPASDGVHELHVWTEQPLLSSAGEVTCRCWPVTLGPGAATAVEADRPLEATFRVSLEAITAFFVIELRDAQTETRFVLTARLEGAPADRRSRLLVSLLGDASRFLRYLLLLLADETGDRFDPEEPLAWLEGQPRTPGWRPSADAPVLEALLRALDRDPGRLWHVEQLIHDLGAQAEALLPPGFLTVWAPIRAVARELDGWPG